MGRQKNNTHDWTLHFALQLSQFPEYKGSGNLKTRQLEPLSLSDSFVHMLLKHKVDLTAFLAITWLKLCGLALSPSIFSSVSFQTVLRVGLSAYLRVYTRLDAAMSGWTSKSTVPAKLGFKIWNERYSTPPQK